MSLGRGPEQRILRAGPRLSSRMQGRTLFVAENPAVFRRVEGSPPLIPGEGRVRYDRYSGALYVSSWRGRELEDDEVLSVPVLGQQGNKPTKVGKLRWNTCATIEGAIRFAGHVLEKHEKKGGEVVEQTKAVIEQVKAGLDRLKTGEITSDTVGEAFAGVRQALVSGGFVEAQKPTKQRLALQLLQASQGTDRLGRFNPLIVRTRLASAWLKLTSELLFAKRVREKYGRLSTLLLTERELERFYLSLVAEAMAEILSMSPTSEEVPQAAVVLLEASDAFLSPQVMKAAPYRFPAIFASVNLFGPQDVLLELRILERFRDVDEAVQNMTLPPFRRFQLRQRRVPAPVLRSELARRIPQCLERIDFALAKGEENLAAPESPKG